jgi:glycosyltransferase involved in cell wall biosynthesis
MKIVYISTSIIPSRSANSIHVMKVCQAFAQNGHEVVLLAPDVGGSRETGVADVYEFYGVDRCFEIVSLPTLKGRAGNHLYEIQAARKAGRLNPDLIYSRSALACLFTAPPIPTVLECHAPINRNWITGQVLGALIKRKNLARFVVITKALERHFLAGYPDLKSKIMVAPDAADTPADDRRAATLASRAHTLNVGYLGHLYPGKGMEVVVPLAERCPWATFHVVGGTESDLAIWRSKTAGMGNVVFYGHQPPAIAASYVTAFDVVLLPNQGSVRAFGSKGGSPHSDIGRWTSPLKMFEYMAHGKAIISSDLPVLQEVMKHGHNALLAPPDDIGAWVSCLKRLNDDTTLRSALGANARKDFLTSHTWLKRSALTIRDLPIS